MSYVPGPPGTPVRYAHTPDCTHPDGPASHTCLSQAESDGLAGIERGDTTVTCAPCGASLHSPNGADLPPTAGEPELRTALSAHHHRSPWCGYRATQGAMF